MSIKIMRLNELLKSIQRFNGVNGFEVRTSMRQPESGFYQVFVDISKNGKRVTSYVSSNIDEAYSSIKAFEGLMEVA